MKIAPFMRAVEKHNSDNPGERIDHMLVHTGQHYDERMSETFFRALNIPEPDVNLEVGSGTHAEQVGQTMIGFEKVLRKEKPDWVVVVGDVNATLACSVTAKKEQVKCCHIEAGLRSGDMTMPEEINRLVTDRLSDLLLIPDKMSGENLIKEGIPERQIRFVGNIMIDTLEANRTIAASLDINEIVERNHFKQQPATRETSPGPGFPGLPPSKGKTARYALLTLHRPSNVDTAEVLEPLVRFLCDEVAEDMVLLWTVHPRTEKMLKQFRLWDKVSSTSNIILMHPLDYHEMLRLNMDATIMLTDSGGLQEECTVLGTPCLTLRWNTERPVTLRQHGGASVLVGNNVDRLRDEYQKTLLLERSPARPPLWDGHAAGRCLEAILNFEG